MKKILIISILFLVVGNLFSVEERTFSIADYGYTVGNTEDATPAMIALLEAVAKADPNINKIINFPQDTYHFLPSENQIRRYFISNHDQDNPKFMAMPLENLENLVIEGNDSLFLMGGRMLPISIISSKNLVIKNLDIDTKQPQIAQVTLKENSGGKALFEVHADTPILIEGGRLMTRGINWENAPLSSICFTKKGHIVPQTSDVGWAGFSGKYINETTLHIPFYDSYVKNGKFTAGTSLALRSWARPTPGVFIDDSKDIKLENVTVHYAEGMGLLAQMTENIHLNGFNVMPRENSGRVFTTQADATHFSACKGLILSENATYEGMMDDAINIHGTYLKVTKRVNNNTLRVRYMHPQAYGFNWGNIGDEVQFVKANTMELVGTINTIKSIRSLDNPIGNGVKIFEITFNEPLDKKVRINCGLENLTWTPEVIFRNNTIRNNRARGTLFSTPRKTIVENNFFDHTSGAAILLAGDCNGWYETGACKEIIIRNNKFVNALTSMFQFTNAIISIYPEIPMLAFQKKYFHSNILIENNEFETFDRPILYAKSVDGIVFQNNTITKNNDFVPFHNMPWTFHLERCTNVKVVSNTFAGGYTFDPKKDVKLKKSSPIVFE